MIPEKLKELLAENKWDEGLTFLKEQAEPLSDELREKMAWCYSRTERYNEAIVIYVELLKTQPTNAKWNYSLGYQFYAQKNYVTAVQHFEQALEHYPNYFKVKYRLAYALIELAGKDNAWTKAEFWKAVKHLNDCHSIYAEYNETEAEKERATYADICALHGKSIVNSAKYIDKAIEYFQTSLRLKEDDDVKYQLAKALFVKGNLDAALKMLPEQSKTFYIPQLKSDIFAAQGDIAKSNEVLLKAVRFHRKDFLHQRLASNFIKLADFQKAVEHALQAVQMNKKNHKNYFACGQAYKAMQQFKTAVGYFEQARAKKQRAFNADFSEALQEIDSIMEATGGNPTDLIAEKSAEVVSESATTEKRHGKVKTYKIEKGFGFITENATGKDLFFHIKQFPFGIEPQVGMVVCFESETTEKGEQAIRIEIA